MLQSGLEPENKVGLTLAASLQSNVFNVLKFGSPGRIRTYNPSVKGPDRTLGSRSSTARSRRAGALFWAHRIRAAAYHSIYRTAGCPLEDRYQAAPGVRYQDIKTAQDLAHVKGHRYQTYLKTLLHEALKEERSA